MVGNLHRERGAGAWKSVISADVIRRRDARDKPDITCRVFVGGVTAVGEERIRPGYTFTADTVPYPDDATLIDASVVEYTATNRRQAAQECFCVFERGLGCTSVWAAHDVVLMRHRHVPVRREVRL